MEKSRERRDGEIVAAAISGESYAAIGAKHGISRQRVQQIVTAAGVPARTLPLRGSDSPHWKGGRVLVNGYVKVRRPGHPRTDVNGYVPEHVVVAEEQLGRTVTRREHVHHINGDRADNRPENLRVMDPGAHLRGHKLKWNRRRLLQELRRLAAELKKTPSASDIIERSSADTTQFQREFGSLRAAQAAAGLTPNQPGKRARALPANFSEVPA